jgi:UrcA family protein
MNTCTWIHRSFSRPATFACVVGLLGMAPALALNPANGQRSMTVTYRDLNLSTVAGATTLYRRIKGAARSVCGEEGRRFDEQRQWKICYRGAIAGAVAIVHSPLLTAVHSGESNESDVTAMLTR